MFFVGTIIIIISFSKILAIADERRKLYGVQFHPEVDLSISGKEILHNFLFDIAGVTDGFTIDNREQKCIQEIRSVVADKKVLVGLLILVKYLCLRYSVMYRKFIFSKFYTKIKHVIKMCSRNLSIVVAPDNMFR